MKTFFILNDTNIDFLFDYLDKENYTLGAPESTGEPGKNEDVKKGCFPLDKTSISYLELYPKSKRYIIFKRWINPEYTPDITPDIIKYVQEHIHGFETNIKDI